MKHNVCQIAGQARVVDFVGVRAYDGVTAVPFTSGEKGLHSSCSLQGGIHMAVTDLNDDNFEAELAASELAVVDFYAGWCGPCRMVAPIVEEISKEFEGQIKVFKLNTDEHPNVASQYGIRSIPTLMVFKGGQKVDTDVGAVPKATLSGTISKYL